MSVCWQAGTDFQSHTTIMSLQSVFLTQLAQSQAQPLSVKAILWKQEAGIDGVGPLVHLANKTISRVSGWASYPVPADMEKGPPTVYGWRKDLLGLTGVFPSLLCSSAGPLTEPQKKNRRFPTAQETPTFSCDVSKYSALSIVRCRRWKACLWAAVASNCAHTQVHVRLGGGRTKARTCLPHAHMGKDLRSRGKV